MANELYSQLTNGTQVNGGNDLLKRFNEFKRGFNGDPQQAVQNLLNSGRVTQAQYNQAVQRAQMLRRMLGM